MSASKLGFCRGERVDILCQLAINEFRGVRSLQFITQDIRLSENYASKIESDREKYLEISEGREFLNEDFIPTRDEVAQIYKFIGYENGMGHRVFSDRLLKSLIDARVNHSINYVKFRLILDILNDMKVMSVTEISKNIFEFEVIKDAQKTSIENSKTYNMLVTNSKA